MISGFQDRVFQEYKYMLSTSIAFVILAMSTDHSKLHAKPGILVEEAIEEN
jgi:hypothetical protein